MLDTMKILFVLLYRYNRRKSRETVMRRQWRQKNAERKPAITYRMFFKGSGKSNNNSQMC
jgi:hypothetical protein